MSVLEYRISTLVHGLTLENLFLLWFCFKLLMVINCEDSDGPDLAWGGAFAIPGHHPHVDNIIHLIHLSPQDDCAIYS